MNKLFLYIILALAFTVQLARAESPVIFDGTTAKWLPAGLKSLGICHLSATGKQTSSFVVNADVDPAAAIVDTKLATISTAGKVSNSATTAASANTFSAIVARDGAGAFSASSITATTFTGALSGNATTATSLAANPTDCGGGQFANAIDAQGNLSCAAAGAGDVTGPAGATDNAIAVYNGATGKVIKNSSPTVSGSTITASLTGAASLNLLLSGGTMSGAIAMGSNKVTGLATCTASGDACDKSYIDAAILGDVPAKDAVNFATTAALPSVVYANGASGVGATLTGVALAAISTDSGSPSVGQFILVKNQASTFQNGVYVVTATGSGIAVFVLTRRTDYDQAVEALAGSSIFVLSGTVNSSTVWDQNSANVATMGTDAITFAQTGGPGSTTIGALDANAANAQGLSFNGSVLSAQSADATHPGMVNTTTQTFAGQKTFSTGVTATVTGNASTATALAANPADCAGGQFANAIAANGDLTCAAVSSAAADSVLTKTANYTVVTGDFNANKKLMLECNCTADCTITFPAASNTGFELDIINIGSATCTGALAGSDTYGSTTDTTWVLPQGGDPQASNIFKANGGTRWNGF